MTIEEIKQRVDIIDIASRYTRLKKVNSNTYKAVQNPLRQERTSSLFFYTNTQRFYDFGVGEGGDAIDFMTKAEGLSILQAKKKLEREIGDYTPKNLCNIIKRQIKQPQATIKTETIVKEFDNFEKIDFSNQEHVKELLEIAPSWVFDEADESDLEFFKSICRYDSINKTLVAAWYNKNKEMVTYKRRRYKGGKWTNRKATRVNNTVTSRILRNNKPLYIVEGAHDFLTAILLGFDVIALPTASFSNTDDLKGIVKGRVVCICEDKQGFECMKRIEQFYKDVKNVNIKLISFNESLKLKLDLSDFVINKSCKQEVFEKFKKIEF